ncbi:sporulation protein YabP [Anaerobacterium chartisolvens]|uniref:Sporulation protein YabP n=1 Tax=Anaerobacterium chartisolvens TaxID=1297424 RepID=A0A369BB92_9FIRM|nr:sporulation protein YabP [Anaerobacterium chartisolvens]RCX17868.1 sporulation protein YabP [Anaerobacterium chartisolvens]
MIEEKKVPRQKSQNIILENREKLSISGVIDVESFNDESVIVDTEMGLLIIRGEDLHINKLNLDDSVLNIEGDIMSCEYSDKEGSKSKGGGFFSKMFK